MSLNFHLIILLWILQVSYILSSSKTQTYMYSIGIIYYAYTVGRISRNTLIIQIVFLSFCPRVQLLYIGTYSSSDFRSDLSYMYVKRLYFILIFL